MDYISLLCIIVFVIVLGIVVSTIALAFKDTSSVSRIITQVTSGRWLLTIAAALCLILMTVTDASMAIKAVMAGKEAKLPFDPSTIFSLMTGVFTFYFLKSQGIDKPDDSNGSSNSGRTGTQGKAE